MRKVRAYITGLVTIATILIAGIVAVPAFASHTDELHEVSYYGAPGEELHGQVTVMNPSNETKVVQVTAQSLQEPHEEWLFLDQEKYTIGPNGKAVISYKVVIPADAMGDGKHIINIREISPNNTLSLKQTVSIFVVRPSAPTEGVAEINIFYTMFFIMIVVAFGIGLTFGGVACIKKVPHLLEDHPKKRASKRGK